MFKKLIDMINPSRLYSPDQLKPTIILLAAALLPTIQIYFGSIQFAQKMIPGVSSFGSASFMFATMFVLMGLIPLAIIIFIFKEPLKDYGFTIGDWRNGLPLTMILIALMTLLLYPSSNMPDFQRVYPFDKEAGNSMIAFLRFEGLRGLLFYTTWEFFFRGFMLFGLRKHVGDWLAICIQTIPSCLWHIGLPAGEIFASIAAGFLFGIIALRTQSILWVFALHYAIGVMLDLLVIM